MGLMLLAPQKSRKCMGGRHAARANISDTRYTIQLQDRDGFSCSCYLRVALGRYANRRGGR
jgi:hypothetical protein